MSEQATTVRFSDVEMRQLDRLKRKLGFSSRADLIRYAVINRRLAATKEQR